MKKIALIIALLVLIGCSGNTSISSVEYSSEQIELSSQVEYSSSIIDLSSSSSVDIPLDYSSSDIIVTVSSSSVAIQSSSSIASVSSSSIRSSSSVKASSSSATVSSSSNIVSSSSIIPQSSSSAISSSSVVPSSSSSYKTSIYRFNIDSSLGIEFYKVHGTNTSPDYEIIGNIIRDYSSYYGTDAMSAGTVLTNGNVETRKMNISSAWIKDLVSNDMIEIVAGKITFNSIPFVASAVKTVNNKSVFVLKRTNGYADEVCFWYDTNSLKWIGSGTQASDANFQNVCGNINNFSF